MKRLLFTVILVIAVLPIVDIQAQSGLKVGFVVEQDLQTSSVADPGPDGVSRLAEIFLSLGAQTQIIRLSEPIPDDLDVVVLPRPLRSLPTDSLARLWRHIENGNNLLLALDPINYPDRRIENSSGGLNRLISADYGVGILDTFVSEPWFSKSTLVDFSGSIMLVHADYLSHPVIDPLLEYEVPVTVWGARTLRVEPFGIESYAHSLLISNTAYGETDQGVIADLAGPAPLEMNVDVDQLGTLSIAGLGENVKTHSRVAILGDTEIIQNGFGLSRTIGPSGGEEARYPGNVLFAERLAAWLLELPIEEWPTLPADFTWIAVDGSDSDWKTNAPVIATIQTDAASSYEVRGFQNSDYLYLLVDAPDEKFTGVQLTYDTLTVSALLEGVTVKQGETGTAIPDARLVKGESLELRIPQRAFGNFGRLPIRSICLLEEGEPTYCANPVTSLPHLPERDAASIRMGGTPLVTINNPSNNSSNLRSAPGTDSAVITSLPNGFAAAALGRNEVSDWIYIANAHYGGWVSTRLVSINTDVNALPVVEAP